MRKLVLVAMMLVVNSAFAYTYNCKSEDESSSMVVKFPEKEVIATMTKNGEETILKGTFLKYEQISNRATKYFYTLADAHHTPAEMTMTFITRGGRFGFVSQKAFANSNTSLTYLGETTFYACYTNYQD